MPQEIHKISNAQLVMMLFCSRLFTLLTFAPNRQAVSGSSYLFGLPLAVIGVGIALIPGVMLCRKGQTDLLSCAFKVGKGYGKAASGLFAFFCLYMAAYTASHFEYFMTSTVYTNTRPWIFVLTLLPVAAYAAYLGLEAFSRFGITVFVLMVGTSILISGVLFSQIDMRNFVMPFAEESKALLGALFYAICNHAEAVLFLLLFARAKNGSGKTAVWWLFWSLLVYEVLSFLTLTALGDFLKTKTFPFYSAAALAQFSSFGRLDLLHITVWVFAAFLRITLYLYCAANCLRRIFPKLGQKAGAGICAVIAGLFAIVTIGDLHFWEYSSSMAMVAVPFILLVVVFPLVTLLLVKVRRTTAKEANG